MTNLDSLLKSRDVTLLTKIRLIKAMVFPVAMYRCERWSIKKAEHQRTNVFKLWCWRRLLRVPWTARRTNQSILKEINPECLLEGLMPKLKLHYFGPPMQRANSLEKTWCWERLRTGEEGATEDEKVGWHHRRNGHEFEQTLGDGQGRTGKPGTLQSMESQRVRHNWATKKQQQSTHNVKTTRASHSPKNHAGSVCPCGLWSYTASGHRMWPAYSLFTEDSIHNP